MEQGESLATAADPLVQRQSSCCPTSNRKPGQKHPRSRQGRMEYSTKEDQCHLLAQAKGLSSPTAQANIQTKEKRQKAPSRYSDMGCTLPFFPGDVRDSMCSPSGGSGTPIHPHSVTLSHIHKHYKCVVPFNASRLACAVLL